MRATMKRYIGALAALLVGMIVVVVLWKPSSEFNHPAKGGEGSTSSVYELRMGHNMPIDSAMHEAALLYAQKIAERSGGRVKITVIPNQELGTDDKMIEMARLGSIDIILTPTAKLSSAFPAMQYVDLPFFFPERDDLYRMLDGKPGRLLLEELSQIGLVGVTFWENGFKHFTANTPLLRPADFKGKKFRIMKSRLIQSQFEALGATTLPIDFHQTRQALVDGIVDGQENPLIAIASMGIHEVQKHLTLSHHGYMGYVFSISAKTYQKLPPDLQDLLIRTAREITPYEREQTHKRETALLEMMRHQGVKIHPITEKERTEFARIMAPIPPRYEELIGPHILSYTQEALEEKYGPSPHSRSQIVIGLNADLSNTSQIGGLAIKRGAELAIEEINAHGGIRGKRVVLIAKDHGGSPQQGVDNLKALAERPDTAAIIGGVQSSVEEFTLPLAEQKKVPYLIPWASSANLTDPDHPERYVFRLSANNRYAIPYLVDYLFRNYRSPVLMYENTKWGRDAAELLRRYTSQKGLPSVSAIPYEPAQREYEGEIDRLIHAKADSLLLIANANEGALILNTLAKKGVYIPVISHWGITGNRFFETTQKARERIKLYFIQTFSFRATDTPESRHLAERYMRRYGAAAPDEIKAPSGVAQTYDLVRLLGRAIEQAGTEERSAIRDALERLPTYKGVVRTYAPPFSPRDHDALREGNFHLVTIGTDGKIVAAPLHDKEP